MKYKLVFILLFLSCEAFSQDTTVYRHVITGSEPFIIESKSRDNYIISNSKYRVILKEKWNGGEMITVINKEWNDTIISIDWGPSYFFGIYNDYLLPVAAKGVSAGRQVAR